MNTVKEVARLCSTAALRFERLSREPTPAVAAHGTSHDIVDAFVCLLVDSDIFLSVHPPISSSTFSLLAHVNYLQLDSWVPNSVAG